MRRGPRAGSRLASLSLLAGVLLGAAGCGTDYVPGGGPDGGRPDGGGIPDAPPPPPGYSVLLDRSWTIPAGSLDVYKCARVTLSQDTYITNWMAEAPNGTHHTVLSIASGGVEGPDGVYDCGVNDIGTVMLYASGTGPSPLDFPQDVGVRVQAGTQIHLNLHLFNATDNPLSGTSGVLVKAQSTPPPVLAEMVFAGTFGIFIPAGATNHTTTGGCTENKSYSLFAVWPHMHQFGTHMRVTQRRGQQTTVLHDGPFEFREQDYYLKQPVVEVRGGDVLRVTCTYSNTTGSAITFGESSNNEMCFAGLYRYPAASSGVFDCVSDLPLQP